MQTNKFFSTSLATNFQISKLLILFLFSLFLFSFSPLQAQKNQSASAVQPDSVRLRLDYIFARLDKSKVSSGFLYEYGYAFVKDGVFNGAIVDSNFVDLTAWRSLYFSVYSSRVKSGNPLPDLTSINTQISSYERQDSSIALPILYLSYHYLKSTAISQNLLRVENEQLVDVAGRPSSPYSNRKVFAVAPTRSISYDGQETFVFRSEMFYSNAGLSITKLQVDFADGAGYKTLTFNTPRTVTYNTAGNKRIRYKITFLNQKQLFS